jgi:CDP-glycerol glycerophosphotransferase (TagB/SpsB family)/glycosyltransferase involved in cell wall biosynthesis
MAALNGARLGKFVRRAKLAAEYEYLARARHAPIDENTVFYESFAGNGMLCNPEALFRALLASDGMDHLNHVWALADLDEYAATVREFAENPRVRFVKYQSPGYFAALARAKYLVNNATFPPQFGKREGQIYLNTWHGTPLKAMGYDIPGGALDTRNVVRNLLAVDFLLAPNTDTAEMYLSAYRMRNIYRGAIVHEGSPRVDRQFATDTQREEIKSQLRRRGVALEPDQQVILYAPTWKGDFYAPINDIRQLRARVDAVSAQIDTTKYRLLLKVHQQVYKHAIAEKGLRDVLVPNDIPTNDVLAVTDLLITDYSSIFIDFLATGRPVLFYTPDLEEYEASRGLYLPVREWPGAICRDLDELAARIKQVGSGGADDPAISHAAAYAAARERYCAHDDGSASARLIDIVFRGRDSRNAIERGFSDGRISVLIHLGGMLRNGITSSGLCLLDNIDHDRFDVTATFPHSTRPDRLELIRQIHPRARVLPRFGGVNGPKLQVHTLTAVRRRSAEQHRRSVSNHGDLLADEWVRCFGAAQFDHVVDFSGYAPFWVKLLGSRKDGSFSIWLHNDIRAEAENPGRSEWLRASLRGVCALYQNADQLVSVSKALCDVNTKKLADWAPSERFTYARNTIKFERVLHLAHGRASTHRRLDSAQPVDPADLTASITSLAASHGIARVRDEAERQATVASLLPPAPGVRTFVTVGRLSSEKNHARLIRAFDLVHQDDLNTRLLILGSGPLAARLEDLVAEIGLGSAITLAGHQPNPYVIVANCDCFVLSSDYEGQPMVLLEALILGRPIVTTDFGSVRGALPDGYGRIVRRSDEALADGMRAFLRGEVPSREFDSAAYNAEAMQEFYRAVGAA